jgi:nucleoside-triphosphatase
MNSEVYIISGTQGSGKTGFAKKLVNMLTAADIPVSGFYAEGFWFEGQRSGFDIVEINGTSRQCLCNTVAEKGDETFRRFSFKQKGLKLGRKLLKNALGQKQVVIVDEVGGMELQGKGWADAIRQLLTNPPAVIILVVRESLVEAVTERFRIAHAAKWEIEHTKPEEALMAIKNVYA